MSLTIEDGTIVPNANSYVTVAEFRAYNEERLREVPAAEADCEALLIKAMDYLQSLDYAGELVDPDQSLLWPRKCVEVADVYLDTDFIPKPLKQAQCVLGFLAQTIELLPNYAAGAKGGIQSESVYGAVARTYFKSEIASVQPYLTQIRSLLGPYLRYSRAVLIRA